MKLVIDVKTNKKMLAPSKDNVILYDGKQWYITTKDDIFKEYQEKVDAKLTEVTNQLEKERKENEEFKANVSSQIVEISENVKKFIKLQGDK